MALGFEGYSYGARAIGRKRVVGVSNDVEASSLGSDDHVMRTPLKRVRSGRFNFNSERSPLEALPLDILIRVLCCVDHEDLEQLLHVSKTIREATEVAKRLHFEYSTPKKKTFAFPSLFDLEDANRFEEVEAPNAPLRKSKSRLNGGKLAAISVSLFASMDEGEQ